MKEYTVQTDKSGTISVFVEGVLAETEKKAVFLTVHDLGCNHSTFIDYTHDPSMFEILDRSVFIHIDVPGQENNAPELPDSMQFPTLDELAADLVKVLDHLNIKCVIGIGEGAGANILARFGMLAPSRCLGLILIHPTSTQAGLMEHVKDKIISWKLANQGMNPTTEQYLLFHRFGQGFEKKLENADNKEEMMKQFQSKLYSAINPKNLKRYVEAFLNRSDISSQLLKGLTVDCLIVTGAKASHIHTVQTMYEKMNKSKAQMLKLDNIGDVLSESPDKITESLLLFCQGLGLLTSLGMPGAAKNRSPSVTSAEFPHRKMSMSDFDQPNMTRNLQ